MPGDLDSGGAVTVMHWSTPEQSVAGGGLANAEAAARLATRTVNAAMGIEYRRVMKILLFL